MLRREFLIGTLALIAFPTNGFAFPDALIVNRTETCGCCGAWVKRMNSAGIRTEVNFVDEKALGLIKTQLGISNELSSCHTATIGSYASKVMCLRKIFSNYSPKDQMLVV